MLALASSRENLIAIENVTHAYRKDGYTLPVLEDLTLGVVEHGFTAVVGPSGCGKSTLTRLIAGLMRPDAGSVWLHGEQVVSPRSTVGMAFQNPVLLEWRSILKNVLLPLEIVPTSLSKQGAEDRARHLLHLVGLLGFEDKRPSELSGGGQQRVAIVRAISFNPKIILADEPTGNLDRKNTEIVSNILLDYSYKKKISLILVTHNMNLAKKCDRVIKLFDGRIEI